MRRRRHRTTARSPIATARPIPPTRMSPGQGFVSRPGTSAHPQIIGPSWRVGPDTSPDVRFAVQYLLHRARLVVAPPGGVRTVPDPYELVVVVRPPGSEGGPRGEVRHPPLVEGRLERRFGADLLEHRRVDIGVLGQDRRARPRSLGGIRSTPRCPYAGCSPCQDSADGRDRDKQGDEIACPGSLVARPGNLQIDGLRPGHRRPPKGTSAQKRGERGEGRAPGLAGWRGGGRVSPRRCSPGVRGAHRSPPTSEPRLDTARDPRSTSPPPFLERHECDGPIRARFPAPARRWDPSSSMRTRTSSPRNSSRASRSRRKPISTSSPARWAPNGQ